MAFSPSSPVTGGAQTGLTSPTYTILADTPPVPHGKQYYVSALGGTQAGVEVHSMSRPFTMCMFKVANPKQVGVPNALGIISNVPNNTLKLNVRKGVDFATSQNPRVNLIEVSFNIPAGADVADPESLRAALSLIIGTLWANSAAIGDSLIGNNL